MEQPNLLEDLAHIEQLILAEEDLAAEEAREARNLTSKKVKDKTEVAPVKCSKEPANIHVKQTAIPSKSNNVPFDSLLAAVLKTPVSKRTSFQQGILAAQKKLMQAKELVEASKSDSHKRKAGKKELDGNSERSLDRPGLAPACYLVMQASHDCTHVSIYESQAWKNQKAEFQMSSMMQTIFGGRAENARVSCLDVPELCFMVVYIQKGIAEQRMRWTGTGDDQDMGIWCQFVSLILKYVLLDMTQSKRIQEALKADINLDLTLEDLLWEYHYLAFNTNWEGFARSFLDSRRSKPGLMFHSEALMNLKKHPIASNFCRTLMFDVVQDASQAHPHICKLLDILPQGDYLLEMWALGRLAIYVAVGAEGLKVPLKRLTTLIRQYERVEGLLRDTLYGHVTSRGGKDELTAWPNVTSVSNYSNSLSGLKFRMQTCTSYMDDNHLPNTWFVPGKTEESKAWPPMQCTGCSTYCIAIDKLRACKGCKHGALPKAWYCSKKCQVKHLPEHRKHCPGLSPERQQPPVGEPADLPDPSTRG